MPDTFRFVMAFPTVAFAEWLDSETGCHARRQLYVRLLEMECEPGRYVRHRGGDV